MPTAELVELASDPKAAPEKVSGAFRALAFSGDPAAVDRLSELLREPHPRAVSLVRLLGHIADPRGLPAVARHVSARDPKLAEAARAAVFEMLGRDHGSSFLEGLEWLEARAGARVEDPAFCDRLKLTEGPKKLAALAATALARTAAVRCGRPIEELAVLPEVYGLKAIELLEQPDAAGQADEIFGRLESYEHDGVPILAEALDRAKDAPLRRHAAMLLGAMPWKAREREGQVAMAPDFVLQRLEAVARGFDDPDESVRLAAITSAANLIESQGDGMMMSTGYRRARFRKGLRPYVEPATKLLADRPEIRAKAEAALNAMRLPR